MTPALEEMVAKEQITSIVKRYIKEKQEERLTSITTSYWFRHTNKRDKKRGRQGFAPHRAEIFVFACGHSGLKAEIVSFGEEGTGVEVTEKFT